MAGAGILHHHQHHLLLAHIVDACAPFALTSVEQRDTVARIQPQHRRQIMRRIVGKRHLRVPVKRGIDGQPVTWSG